MKPIQEQSMASAILENAPTTTEAKATQDAICEAILADGDALADLSTIALTKVLDYAFTHSGLASPSYK